jgi:regulatory protein
LDELTREEAAASAAPEDAEGRAMDAALNFLSYRQRTGHEVRRKLASRGFSDPVIDAAMRRLSAVGLVDDEAFVSSYVRDRIAHRPMGVRRMVQELYSKGIPRKVALPVIEQVFREENTDERSLAERVVEKKRRSFSRGRGDPAVARKRVRDHLLRRGFDARIAQDVVEAMFPPDERESDG